MGKAGRRKKNRQKQKQQLQRNSDPIGDDKSNSTTIVNPNSAVHQLRHVDPKIRHSALVALQASVLSQLHCASNRPVSMTVLQAVREQVTSTDLECSAVAADCIAQYLAAVSSSSKTTNNAHYHSEKHKQTTASWGLVLLGRLQDCRKALVEQQQQQQQQQSATLSKNQRMKAQKVQKHWYAVAAPCFIALCHLIEDNGHALDQINLQKKTFVEVVFGMLSLELTKTTGKNAPTDDTAMKDDDDDEETNNDTTLPHDAIFETLRETTALYAARCLHSALDDNWELAEALECGAGLWKEFLSSNGEGGNFLAPSTRLHLLGCLVNLYQLSFTGGRATSWQEDTILEFGIQSSSSGSSQGLLLEILLSSEQEPNTTTRNPPATSPLRTRLAENDARYRAAQKLLEQQQLDQKMEEEVETKVKERKEPAKLIARRQRIAKEAKRKEFQEQQKAKMIAEAELDDTDMADADGSDHETNDRESGTIPTRERDGEEARNEALVQWTSTTGSIQLGLEIVTNLLSTWIAPQFGDVQMGSGNPRATKLFRAIQQQGMAVKLAETLTTLSEFLGSCTGPPDDPIRGDGEETVGKVSACVVNCFLSGIVVVDPISNNTTQAANDLLLWETAMNGLRSELSRASPSKAVLNACSSILAVAVEMKPGILRSSGAGSDYIALFQKLLPEADGVCLLSPVVLMEAESNASATETIVRSLTEGFLQLLRLSPDHGTLKTQTIVLKTFMDWYGNDNFYPQLYEVLRVSEGIAASLALVARSRKDLELDEEQLQILHNSERFLEYKKQLNLR